MFFKRVFCFSLSLTAASLFVGCDNSHNFEEEDPVVTLNYDTDCLSDIGTNLELYFESSLPTPRLQASFQCLQEGIDYFQSRIKQDKLGFYSVKEIRNVFNKVLSDTEFTTGFYENIFILKAQLFGGPKLLISESDITVLKNFLTSLEALLIKLMPHAENLFFGEGEISDQDLETSLASIKLFLNKWLFFQESFISEKNIFEILLEVADSEDSAIQKGGESWYKVFDLLRKATEPAVILHEEKENAINKITEVLGIMVKLNKSFSKDWINKRDDFLVVSSSVDNVIRLVENSLDTETSWDETDLLDIMKILEALDFLPEDFDAPVQKEVVRIVFDKFFPDGINDNKGELSQNNFRLLEDEWGFFKNFLNQTQNFEGYFGEEFPYVYQGEDPFSRWTRTAWPVLVHDHTDTLYLTDRVEKVGFRFRSLFHMSWQVTAAQILVRSYAKDEERAKKLIGLELFEVRDAYQDIFEVLLAIGILDENSRNSWFRIFNELNLFVPSAQPDQYAGLMEAAEYLAYLYSGINAADQTSDFVQDHCPFFEKKCVEKTFEEKSKKAFMTMPTLSDYFKDTPSMESLEEWHKSFEFIAKLTHDDQPYSGGLIFRSTIANQYVETIFKKFDQNHDDKIDFFDTEFSFGAFKEALKFLPQVKGTAAENDDDFLFTFFSFFIKEGRLPKFRNGNPRREFWRWKADIQKCRDDWDKDGPKKCGFKVDRARILSLLSFLTAIDFVD